MADQAAGKPICYLVGGFKAWGQVETTNNTLEELEKHWAAIATCEDQLWEIGEMGPDAAPKIHKLLSGK